MMFLEETIRRESYIISFLVNLSYEWEELRGKSTTQLISKDLQVRDDKVVTLNFVNQMEDKDDELVLQSFMLTIFRKMQVDLT